MKKRIAVFACGWSNEYLMAIADGMGGHSAGEVASSIAIGYLGKHFTETFLNSILS
mgnify:CR=1 FL=1